MLESRKNERDIRFKQTFYREDFFRLRIRFPFIPFILRKGLFIAPRGYRKIGNSSPEAASEFFSADVIGVEPRGPFPSFLDPATEKKKQTFISKPILDLLDTDRVIF